MQGVPGKLAHLGSIHTVPLSQSFYTLECRVSWLQKSLAEKIEPKMLRGRKPRNMGPGPRSQPGSDYVDTEVTCERVEKKPKSAVTGKKQTKEMA